MISPRALQAEMSIHFPSDSDPLLLSSTLHIRVSLHELVRVLLDEDDYKEKKKKRGEGSLGRRWDPV